MTLVTPADATGPLPVIMMFGGGGLPQPEGEAAPVVRGAHGSASGDPPATQQLIAAGWGYASINPASIQADNGAGLTRGVIGLVNRGQPRRPDDWGALRAWAWGASRGLDSLETDGAVDARHVGIEGVSRYGKAALETMAFDTRFAVVLVGSSGEGGAKLHRRNWGEAVENLTAPGEYHWMAGNFLKYGASEAVFGSKNAGDLPVDAHELIALCAPRLTFISYGVPEKGDSKWLDYRGSFMAAVAAGPVFRLPGAKDLGTSDDHHTEKTARQCGPARWPTRLASARRRTYRRSELAILHSVGRQVLRAHSLRLREARCQRWLRAASRRPARNRFVSSLSRVRRAECVYLIEGIHINADDNTTDDQLMRDGLRATGLKTKRETVERLCVPCCASKDRRRSAGCGAEWTGRAIYTR
jgi:hypothetical protein